MTLREFDEQYRQKGCSMLCGVDEAGRGPLAGPVYAAAVILPTDIQIAGINDSKKLNEKKRELLYEEIKAAALAFCVATASEAEIDEINILNASFLAMKRAVQGLSVNPDYVLVDGNIAPGFGISAEPVIKGDALSESIAAASVLAKVERDNYMRKMAELYPHYMFEKHKGYPTKLHYERLDEFGPSDIHRMSFLKKWAAGKK